MVRVIEAAGGLLWRERSGELEVALVHRPRYDDWSLPKGKLAPGEHPLVAALREVYEETGSRAEPGRPLGERRYLADGQPKRVRYWVLQATGGVHVPHDEVDEVSWLPPERAERRLAAEGDRLLLQEFLVGPRVTWPWILVRHAHAEDRERWRGEDAYRPLDPHGLRQAKALAQVLVTYRPSRLFSADLARCTQTLRPVAEDALIPLRTEPLLSERAWRQQRSRVEAFAGQTVDRRLGVVLCSQGGPVPELAEQLCAALGTTIAPLGPTKKGAAVVVHLASLDGRARPVAVELLGPL
ncbi:MAG: 8-oxo-(d)GTP phosphatase [Mycobacteriales bacterium]